MTNPLDNIDVMVFVRFRFDPAKQTLKRLDKSHEIIFKESDFILSIMNIERYLRYRQKLIDYPDQCFYKEIQRIKPKMK